MAPWHAHHHHQHRDHRLLAIQQIMLMVLLYFSLGFFFGQMPALRDLIFFHLA